MNETKSLSAVVCANAEESRRDRASLTRLNYARVVCFEAGREAFESLLQTPADVILTAFELRDMSGATLIKMLKGDSRTAHIPVIMVTHRNTKETVLRAISAGCAGYVLRPYSESVLQRHLNQARSAGRFDEIEREQLGHARELVLQGDFDAAIDEFSELAAAPEDAQHYFDLGTRYLLEQKYGKSIIAFNKAIKINELFAEAYRGLADAYKGKGDTEKYQQYLKRAADIYAFQDRLQETKELFAEILATDAYAVNPYNNLGVQLRHKGDLAGAIRAYARALELTPKDENIHYNVAKAYHLSGQTGAALTAITSALELNPSFEKAREIYSLIAKREWHVPAEPGGGRISESLTDV
ncbi:MAG: tetratricopeptide repeat protein [Desulfovibrionaceae bacterium]|nr:tetratricopeptide repeat protein [Desulfovibrionaceae bacterium]MBF0513908.1 tetratricopeptide repeat protein [Desulfovibrionaceae bacterium]